MSQISSLLQCGVRKIWLHELLKRSILTNLASCSGNWRKIGPKSQQYKIWFLQGCSRLEVKSGNLMSGSSPSPWTSVNSADFLCINCAPEVRVWQVQIQANISLPEYPVMSLQERLLIIFDINFLLKLSRRFMNKALSNVTYLSSAAKVHSREMTVEEWSDSSEHCIWETNFCWTKRVRLLLILTVRENHDNLLHTQTVFNL